MLSSEGQLIPRPASTRHQYSQQVLPRRRAELMQTAAPKHLGLHCILGMTLAELTRLDTCVCRYIFCASTTGAIAQRCCCNT